MASTEKAAVSPDAAVSEPPSDKVAGRDKDGKAVNKVVEAVAVPKAEVGAGATSTQVMPTEKGKNEVVDRSPNDQSAQQAAPIISTAKWLRLLVIVTTCLALFMALAVVVRLLDLISHTLLLFSLGALFAYALEPMVRRVRYAGGKDHPRWLGVLVVFTVLILIFVLGAVLLGTTLTHQVQYLIRDQEQLKAKALAMLGNVDQWLAAHGIPVNLEQYANDPPPEVKARLQNIAKDALRLAERFSASLVEGALVVLISLYFLIYSKEMRTGVNRNLPASLLPYAEQWQNDVNRILGGFVRGQLILALITGVVAAIGCAVLQVPFWLLIGVFVVIASLIPVVGPYLGGVPAIISAALSQPGMISPGVRVVLVIILFFIINEAGSKILYPRLVGAALGLHEVLVLFALLAGFEAGHLWGVLFAAPLTALAIVTSVQLYHFWVGLPPISLSQLAKTEGAEAKAHGTP